MRCGILLDLYLCMFADCQVLQSFGHLFSVRGERLLMHSNLGMLS